MRWGCRWQRGVCKYSSWSENGPLAFWPDRKKVSPGGWTWSSWTTRRLVAHQHGAFCPGVTAVSNEDLHVCCTLPKRGRLCSGKQRSDRPFLLACGNVHGDVRLDIPALMETWVHLERLSPQLDGGLFVSHSGRFGPKPPLKDQNVKVKM